MTIEKPVARFIAEQHQKLRVVLRSGRAENVNGRAIFTPGITAEFNRIGGGSLETEPGKFVQGAVGYFQTDDPETILLMRQHRAYGKAFKELPTPEQEKAQMRERIAIEKARIAELEASLGEDGDTPAPEKPKKPKRSAEGPANGSLTEQNDGSTANPGQLPGDGN